MNTTASEASLLSYSYSYTNSSTPFASPNSASASGSRMGSGSSYNPSKYQHQHKHQAQAQDHHLDSPGMTMMTMSRNLVAGRSQSLLLGGDEPEAEAEAEAGSSLCASPVSRLPAPQERPSHPFSATTMTKMTTKTKTKTSDALTTRG